MPPSLLAALNTAPLRAGFALVCACAIGVFTLAPAAGQGNPTVIVTANTTYGPILTDPAGMTLYTWAGDEQGVSRCNGNCATAWPPLLTQGSPVAPAGVSGTLGTAPRDDGTMVVTYNGWPLYYYARDTQAGDTNGEGSTGAGALWSIVKVEMAVVQPSEPAASAPTAPPASAPPVSAPPVSARQTPAATAVAVSTAVPAMAMTTAPVASGPVTVTIRDFTFRPSTASVQTGGMLTWTNMDNSPHTATADDNSWDTGPIGPRQPVSMTFPSAGTLNYHCSFHPSMKGSITVSGASMTTLAPSPSMAQPGQMGMPGPMAMSGQPGTRPQGTINYALPYYGSTGSTLGMPSNAYYYNPATGNYYAGGYANNNPYVNPLNNPYGSGVYGFGQNYYPYAGSNGSGVPQYGNNYGAGSGNIAYGSGIPFYGSGYGSGFGAPFGSGVPFYGSGYGYGFPY